MGRFKIGIAVALATFIIGVVAASLWIINNQHLTEQTPPVPAVAVRQTPNHPEGWIKIDVDGKLTFYLPPDMKQEKELGNIEYSGPNKSFGSKTLNVGYMYVERHRNDELWRGRVSCDLLMRKVADRPGSRSSEVEIGGRRAMQVFGQAAKPSLVHTTLCFPDAGNGTVLTFGASYEEERAVDAAKVIGSIEFP